MNLGFVVSVGNANGMCINKYEFVELSSFARMVCCEIICAKDFLDHGFQQIR